MTFAKALLVVLCQSSTVAAVQVPKHVSTVTTLVVRRLWGFSVCVVGRQGALGMVGGATVAMIRFFVSYNISWFDAIVFSEMRAMQGTGLPPSRTG